MTECPVTFADVQVAQQCITPWIHRTPVMTSSKLDTLTGAHLYFKCENLQKVGAFKARGACHAVARWFNDATELERTAGVMTHSSGNHAAALAYAASIHGVPARVVMPRNAPAVKKQAVADYGALIVECEPGLPAREAATQSLIEQSGAYFVPPYDHPHIIAGQGTTVLEFYEQVTDIDVLMAPVGGGGLLAGSALASRHLRPSVSVIAAEPKAADDAARGFYSSKRVAEVKTETVADGLRTTVGINNFPIICQHVDDILTVSEGAIVNAMQLLWTRLKMVVEASSAVPLAAILENPERFRSQHIAIILSGGNVDLESLPF